MAPKKGGGLIEALWSGTAVFAAVNSSTFLAFLSKFFVYALVLILGMMVVGWVLRQVTGREMFSVGQIQCPSGSSPVEKCPGTGTPGCLHASGNCEASLGQ
jgi:cytochrome b561